MVLPAAFLSTLQRRSDQTTPVREKAPRRARELKRVVHHVVTELKPERHVMSIDEERASIKARVSSFCGRHPKDIACQPTQGEPSTSAQAPKEP